MSFFKKIKNIHSSNDCCQIEETHHSKEFKKIILVGFPNVGKSALFNTLTNSYVTVSNYPGTTVGISKTITHIAGKTYEVIDTPGMYSLLSLSEEEKIARKIIISRVADIVIHVIDAKNIERMLSLTLQLMEAHLPIILVLNLFDELETHHIEINIQELEKKLKIPVISMTATKGIGTDKLREAIQNYSKPEYDLIPVPYSVNIEEKIKEMDDLLSQNKQSLSRIETLLYLQDELPLETFQGNLSKKVDSCMYEIAVTRQRKASELSSSVFVVKKHQKIQFADWLNNCMIHPLSGSIILLLVVYIGLYLIVGKFGAGIAVDFLENFIFKKYINPFFIHSIPFVIPWPVIQDLFIGEYGILTLGVRYAIAIILPIVGVFFFVFAIIEDSGYLPRLAMLIDRIFKKIGLSGRAVIPMVLGLGCSTMATMVTRTLPTRRERIMATILLALAIPCSAQLGVLFTLLAPYPHAMMLWALFISGIFLIVGYLGAKLLPGSPPIFFMELPPLRIPTLSDILIKTYARLIWYLKEVFPLFICASVLLWIGQMTGLFVVLIDTVGYFMQFLGLPKKTAISFVLGFFRRDFGAAGLYDMQRAGEFTVNQLTVAIITMTLFPACIAQALMMVKERGNKMGIAIFIFCICMAFFVGFITNLLLTFFNIYL